MYGLTRVDLVWLGAHIPRSSEWLQLVEHIADT